MKAGFFNLFRWGRYGGGGHPSALNDDACHDERERFAVAAVAFCLTHHKEFRQHFLQNCCKLPADSSLDKTPHIAVEDKKWGDLAIWQPGQWAYVFEFKLGDGSRALEDHQNPTKRQFDQKGTKVGYGLAIRRAKQQEFGNPTHCKYIVLGWDKELKLNRDQRVECDQLHWKDLVPSNQQRDEFLEDLWQCLGYLGVPEFQLRRFKDMKLQSSTKSAAQIFKLLEGITTFFDLDGRKERWNVDATPSGAHFGVDIPSGGTFSELSEHVGRRGEPIGWFGYEFLEDAQPRISVWLYSKTEQNRESTETFAKARSGLSVNNHQDPDGCPVYVTREPGSDQDDKSWFQNVLGKLSDRTNRS